MQPLPSYCSNNHQTNLTPPVDELRISHRETFRRAYDIVTGDADTPDNLTGFVLLALVRTVRGALLLTLTEGAGITRTANRVVMELTTAQLTTLSAHAGVSISLVATSGSYVDELLIVNLTFSVGGQLSGYGGMGAVKLLRNGGTTSATLHNVKGASVAYIQDLLEQVETVAAGLGILTVTGETPTGLVNGNNATFTALSDFVPESVEVFISGFRLTLLADYNTSGNRTITLFTSPLTGELVRINYSRLT